MDQNQPGEEKLIWLTCSDHGPTLRELRQKLKQKTWKNPAGWLASLGLLSNFSYTVPTHLPEVGSTHNEVGLPPSIRNQENALQTSAPTSLF